MDVPIYHLPILDFKSIYLALSVINYIPFYNRFPMNEISQTSVCTIAISMASCLTSYIPWIHQAYHLQLGIAMPYIKEWIILIYFVYHLQINFAGTAWVQDLLLFGTVSEQDPFPITTSSYQGLVIIMNCISCLFLRSYNTISYPFVLALVLREH